MPRSSHTTKRLIETHGLRGYLNIVEKKPSAGSEAAKLRDEIDRGVMSDKVNHPDPAAAPLGTDDEAAGRLPPASVIAEMRRDQRAPERKPPSRAIFYFILFLALLAATGAGWSLL